MVRSISIHAPREGSDDEKLVALDELIISIHAPREGSDADRRADPAHAAGISIHAPREGSDVGHVFGVLVVTLISIHAPREGSDAHGTAQSTTASYFNPRSPRGERHGFLIINND